MSSPTPATAVVDPIEYNPSATIEADTPNADDSSYGGSAHSSATHSVTSSVRDYVYDNGRRYHRYGGEGKYTLPNDETEQGRLDLMHHLCLQLLGGKLHLAPLPVQVNRVLDCGTGTGIWALDFGEVHPEAQVFGVDLSPIQPTWVWPNVKFEVDNLDEEWTWREEYFDLIHARHIMDGIKDIKKLARQMYKHLAPGGWVEIAEVQHDTLNCDDGTYDINTTKLGKYIKEYTTAATKAGFKVEDVQDQITEALKEAGFEDVKVHKIVVPWGDWAKDKRLKRLGATMAANLETGMEAYGLALLTKVSGYTTEEAKKLCAEAMEDVLSGNVHAYYFHYQILGRKPEA